MAKERRVICSNCGNEWPLKRAHIVTTSRTPEGCRELVQCPACGFQEEVIKPNVGECNGD